MYQFFEDPGHGWLKVQRSELRDLGIEHKISSFSYQEGQDVYLEEDCDISIFANAKLGKNYAFSLFSPGTVEMVYHENTPVRTYSHFRPESN